MGIEYTTFLPQPQITQAKPGGQGSAFDSWLMQPAAVKQPWDKQLNVQHRNKHTAAHNKPEMAKPRHLQSTE